MVGLGKQGKTLFYRDLLQHLHHSNDLFVEAPGIRGQVMHVFNLPSYHYVFKVIRDVFGPSKTTDRETVKAKFRMVKAVDRVGRMTDALEFTDLALPLDRFSAELLEQLRELARSTIEIDDGSLILRHCYVERRLVPLNLHLETASAAEVARAVVDYGNAIRELAIANIFPGDLLWRNFGVNRQGRVVFYDYDEIELLTDCIFRDVPPAPSPEMELAGEPWYPVGPRDVYPEEFGSILLQSPLVREPFLGHHSALLRAAFWQECQRRVAAGEIVDFFAYPDCVRLQRGRRRV
jgi:isocitrate dehydrogenase kinase/phosphatase